MNTEEIGRNFNAVIYLISCHLNGKVADRELLSHVSINDIYSAAVRHSLDALVTTALEAAGFSSPKAAEKKLLAIRKNMLFDSARAEILSRLEEKGIKYMPLKGVIMKELYPSVGLRQMSDNDILFDAAYRADVRDIMTDLGYYVKLYEFSNQDVYMKDPVLNFEMHVALFTDDHSKTFEDYFSVAFDRAVSDGVSKFGYKMTDEDFYVFMKAHEYKHYTHNGTGLRSLVDVYVYLRSKGDSLDYDYVRAECEKLGAGNYEVVSIADYEAVTRDLAMHIFDPEVAKALVEADRGNGASPISVDERNLLNTFIDSATYGTQEISLNNLLDRKKREENISAGAAKRRFFIRLIFPDMDYYRTKCPDIDRKKYLIPVIWLKRGFAAVFKRPKGTYGYFKRIFKAKSKDK